MINFNRMLGEEYYTVVADGPRKYKIKTWSTAIQGATKALAELETESQSEPRRQELKNLWQTNCWRNAAFNTVFDHPVAFPVMNEPCATEEQQTKNAELGMKIFMYARRVQIGAWTNQITEIKVEDSKRCIGATKTYQEAVGAPTLYSR